MTRTFNNPNLDWALWEPFELGWQHTVDADGNLDLVRDDDGNLVPTVRRVRRLAPFELLERSGGVPEDIIAVCQGDGLKLLEVLDHVVGQDVLVPASQDPTVTPAALWEAVDWFLDITGLDRILGLTGVGDDDEVLRPFVEGGSPQPFPTSESSETPDGTSTPPSETSDASTE